MFLQGMAMVEEQAGRQAAESWKALEKKSYKVFQRGWFMVYLFVSVNWKRKR